MIIVLVSNRQRHSNACFGSLSWSIEDMTLGQINASSKRYGQSSKVKKRNQNNGTLMGDLVADRDIYLLWPGIEQSESKCEFSGVQSENDLQVWSHEPK
jgi:hypothetical protein